MEEKIKIYVTESVNNILLKDMEGFEFYKKDGSFNKNEFYNTLIIHYYEDYQRQQSEFFDKIQEIISENINAKEITISDIAGRILEYADIKANKLDEQKSEIALSIKPTRKSSDIFDFIENYCLKSSTLSSYFRNMFASYSLLPQDRRERIIFRNNFELIEKAIHNQRKIYFSTGLKENVHIVSPFKVCNSKEELYNYLLASEDDRPFSFRVGKMKNIKVLNEPADYSIENVEDLKKMEELGPQYRYEHKKSDGLIKVYLTDKGKQMYKSFYLHRPKLDRIEEDFYYFDCSKMQAYQYFSRFGKHGVVLEPTPLMEKLKEYYFKGNKAYRNYFNDGTLPQQK